MVALLISPAAVAQDYEVPGSIALAKAAPQALLEGSQGKIGDPVSNDGMLNTYMVTAPRGNFTVTSTHSLCKLVREVNAIQELAVLDKSEAFTEQAKESARNLGSVGKRLVRDPGKTLKSAAKGVGDIFGGLGDRIEEELSPRHQVAITNALAAMEGVEGKQYLIRRAANAKSYEEGFDRQVQTEMYQHIHSERPIRRFVDIGGDRVVAEATDGSVLIATTVDHLVWTEGVDRLMQHKNQRIADLNLKGSRRLWLTGNVSKRAREGFADLDWSVRTDLIHDYVGTLCNPAVPKLSLTDE